ncbi:MAG: corrinoid protein [Firmicutes bacterium]|nr:corrinoid protein [Bacillota bacterium]
MMILDEISEQLIIGRAPVLADTVKKALDEGYVPAQIINGGLIKGMDVIGERFKNNEVFVPEVMMAARAMKAAMEVLKPLLKSGDVSEKGTVVIGTVKGDQHDIGKNLVAIMLESKGFRVIDLGVNVAPEKYVETAIKENADIIACSALLTTTMINMKAVVELAKEKTDSKVKVMIGGAPVTQSFCDQIGADGYSEDAAAAAELAERLVS